VKLKETGTVLLVGGVLVAALAVGLIIYRLDLQMLHSIVLILVSGLVLAAIVAASALPIRALKKQDNPPEKHVFRERHTIERDGRVPHAPKIYTIPQQQQGMGGGPGLFPDLLRAAYLAGHRQLRDGGQEVIEANVRDVTEEWQGEVKE